MTAAVDIWTEGESFYVPHFEVKLEERALPEDVVRDVLEVKYTDDVEQIDAFELRLNNWDAELRRSKYEPPSSDDREGLFDPGKKLELSLGYLGNTRLMLTGEITTLEPSYPAAGGSTLSVRGLNRLHNLRTEQHSYAWTDRRDSDVAAELGRRPVRRNRPGLGLEVRTNPRDSEAEEPYIFMDNQYDVVFLLTRARRHGYEVVLREEERDGESVEYLYFGPSESRREPAAPYRLEWGKSLVSFRPTLTTAKQISEVVVRGWDRRRNRRIEEKRSWSDLYPRRSAERNRMQGLARAFGNRRLIVTDRPVHTRRQARALAEEILRDQLKQMVKATGSTVGLPDLRSGRRVEIVGLGERFDGEYYLTSTTHSLGDSGYRTELEARREGPAGDG